MYCSCTVVLLQKYARNPAEEKEKPKNRRLHGDGKPRLLIGDEFQAFALVDRDAQAQEKAAVEREVRRERREEHSK